WPNYLLNSPSDPARCTLRAPVWRRSRFARPGFIIPVMAKTPHSDQNQFANKAQAWSARFSEPVSDLVKRYTASVDFDKRLAHYDIHGSLAHADMLAAQGIISA